MNDILEQLDLRDDKSGAATGSWLPCQGPLHEVISPVNGEVIGRVKCASKSDYDTVAAAADEAFQEWSMATAPKRGEIVRQIGNALREDKTALGALGSLECGKIRAEGEGEVQEMIDIADFAVGQSRMLYGLSMHSERPGHRMYEQWHPLGPIGVISAFNFPVAVWSWNAMISMVAGNTVIWKPSSKGILSAIATMKIVARVLADNGWPEGVLNLVIGDRGEVGTPMLEDTRLPLISATGSFRLGRTILELGGNNGIIVTPTADMDLTVRAIVFGAVGPTGQRCTTTRRIIAHKDILPELTASLIHAYRQVNIGNPLEEGVLMGPLIDTDAVTQMQDALEQVKQQGGRVLYGGKPLTGGIYNTGTYVEPCICEARADMPIVAEETFAPILYLIPYTEFEEAIAYHNGVPQGLSSAVFTNDLRESEAFLSHRGSDCGIANVNIGTSGAEIGGAFGGEKETGGGREAGSDAWRAYMRRQTCTTNWSGELPLAQGIEFDVG